ncbi:alpha/beta hydrolase [Herbiconiux sp. CPCC 203407]|uniref:Alpha/beta hydrolase n=1 Tax=Herbiconiux oxytropis TaxID=2970915 RepID=A0AA42BRR5_9MICO|nr:alpha/beta hydrolase [Herbiconiux oxytropis]MCS5720998.1 alpha/beta hydrolase [Herbiconiux oxytropis]MCS5724475.1 alpha/beta hydrolase [Herbiconiux oxytropis]
MSGSAPFAVELATLRWGEHTSQAPAVLLLHGIPSAAGTWWRVASLLAEQGCAVTAADLRGHGASPRTTDYSLDGYAADVVRLRPGAGTDEMAAGTTGGERPWDLVIGHSLGGAVSVVAAAAAPRWARTLLLLDPVIAVDHEEADDLVADLLGDLEELDPAELLRRHPRWHAEDAVQKVLAARVVSPFVVERTVLDNTTSGPAAGRWQLDQSLAALAPRVHVLAADPECGAIFSPQQGAALTAATADATVQTVVGAGHSVHRDAPGIVVAAALALMGQGR